MESKKPAVKVQEEKQKGQEDQKPKVIEWEDYEEELARLCSLTSALEEAATKIILNRNSISLYKVVETQTLSRTNELDEMHEKLESRKLVMGNMSMRSKVVEEKVRKQEEQLSSEIRSLLVAGTAFSAPSKRMQDSNRSPTGEKGYVHLKNLQKSLRLRQRYMVSQVSMLYPVKVVIGRPPEQELESFTRSIKSGVPLDQNLLIKAL
ncbi:UV radiation resistance-associated gene [Olea europaea subsp. europaea]|uniref:UV radiation resistance-associated protein n=1 Tax=Olea europaea subsp. europaea TaxID=158383 RepID=A0A8S0V9Q4_OLEEU|nr:UV radiation resistance-associated gene [Olea europaea subsp. europaea]